MAGVRGDHGAWMVLGLVLLLGASGCGDEEKPQAPAAAPTPTPSMPAGIETEPPEPPADPPGTPEGAEEQARYVAQVVQHAIRVRDATPVAALARDQADCDSCRQLADYIDGLKEDELWEDVDDLELGRLTVRSTGEDSYRVRGPAVYPRISFVDLEGEEQAKQDESRYDFWVDLIRDTDAERWQIEDYALVNKGKK